MKQVARYTIDSINAAMTNILSPNVLPVEELKNMLRHIRSQLPSTVHLPTSLDDTLHFYWYVKTHVLIADKQFLLLINVPIQDRVQQLQIYEIFNLPVPQCKISAHHKINSKYIGVKYDETQAVVITKQQYLICLHVNGQFCKIDAHSTLTNPPSCIAALYAKNDHGIGTSVLYQYFTHHLHFHPL